MDSRLNLAMIDSREVALRRRSEASRARRAWPDDGLAPRAKPRPERSLHPTAVLASLLTWR